MAKFNMTALTSSVRTAEQAGARANAAHDDMTTKYDRALTAIREFNTSRQATLEAFEAAAKDVESVRNIAGDLSGTIATLPEPIPEPPVGPPPVDGEDEVTVRGRRVR